MPGPERPARWTVRRTQIFSGALLLGLQLMGMPAACRADFRFEAESAVAAGRVHNEGGAADLFVKQCAGASGGLAVEGMDFPGDWIEFDLELGAPFCFQDSVRCAGVLDASWHFHVLVFAQGEIYPVVTDTLPQIMGRGIG